MERLLERNFFNFTVEKVSVRYSKPEEMKCCRPITAFSYREAALL